MAISRMDLADVGSPELLVKVILKEEQDLPIPVPVEDICRKLDIIEFQEMKTTGFEGGLLTDADRSSGIILFKKDVSEQRRRFTIAHELGHFLMPTHMPDQAGRFLCSRTDMQMMSAKEADRRARMEVEANRFASLILIPPPALRLELGRLKDPDLQHIPKLARAFNVSKEAMARAYVNYHEQSVAIIVVHNERILRIYKNSTKFPFIKLDKGNLIPQGSLYHRRDHSRNIASDILECVPDLWIEISRGERAPTMFEQVYLQQDNFALIMLHLMKPDEDDEREEQELERSWQLGFAKRTRRR